MNYISLKLKDVKLPKRGSTQYVLQEIAKERLNQDVKWGEQNHSDGTGYITFEYQADQYKRLNTSLGPIWSGILLEEVYEALAEKDVTKLREELLQVAAVSVAWIQAIDRRTK